MRKFLENTLFGALILLIFSMVLFFVVAVMKEAGYSSYANNAVPYTHYTTQCVNMSPELKGNYITVFRDGKEIGQYKLHYYAECSDITKGTLKVLSVIDSNMKVHVFKGSSITWEVTSHVIVIPSERSWTRKVDILQECVRQTRQVSICLAGHGRQPAGTQ